MLVTSRDLDIRDVDAFAVSVREEQRYTRRKLI
jgi:hypothetical protein